MHRRHWREIVEIVGVISIVAALLLVAWQLRQGNRIAAADVEIQLAQRFRSIHLIQATDPEFAKLFPKLAAPESHLITATEDSQIDGLARQYTNLFAAVQAAYDNRALTPAQFETYLLEAQDIVERYPGMRPYLLQIYEASPALHGKDMFRPIAELATETQPSTE